MPARDSVPCRRAFARIGATWDDRRAMTSAAVGRGHNAGPNIDEPLFPLRSPSCFGGFGHGRHITRRRPACPERRVARDARVGRKWARRPPNSPPAVKTVGQNLTCSPHLGGAPRTTARGRSPFRRSRHIRTLLFHTVRMYPSAGHPVFNLLRALIRLEGWNGGAASRQEHL